ncbi:MAG: hypothetical protein ACRD2W_02285 [Acidimicrobiales bacterium]
MCLLGGVAGAQIGAAPPASAAPVPITFTDVNPDASTNADVNSASGGRTNGLSSTSGNNQIFYAATEFGGLYRTTDGGANWAHLVGHLPMVTWDVEVDPTNNNRVYATSFFDGKATSVSGIQRSTDAGATWSHPATATPPAASAANYGGCPDLRRLAPSAFGISVNAANSNAVIGTNCGVGRTIDGGATWAFSDPTPGTAATNVWDVFVQPDGTVLSCGNDGVHRSTDGGANWNAIAGNLPGDVAFGRCSVTASPDENYVLFVEFGGRVFESDDTGATWTEFLNSRDGGRIPFITANNRTAGFDLWVGRGVNLFRAPCTTPAMPAPGGANRCPTVPGWVNTQGGAHLDTGDVVFDTGVANDRCPRVYSSDGGVHTAGGANPGCHTPGWTRANVGLHALWLYSMSGADQAGDVAEDLYMGAQDTGSFAATNGGATPPTWTFPDCCDVFNVVANPTRVVWDVCCFNVAPADRLFYGGPGMAGPTQVATLPPGAGVQGLDLFTFPDFIDTYGANDYVAVTGSGAFTTNDITANPVVWTARNTGAPPGGFCTVQASVSGGTPTFYAQTGCQGNRETGINAGGFQLWRLQGLAGTWDRIDDNFGVGGTEIFAVDPNNPNRLYASHLSGPEGVQMIRSTDGGTTWQVDAGLTAIMDGNNDFRMSTASGAGATSFTTFNGYLQPTLLAFDPEDANTIVAGGRDSGVFLTRNGGLNWALLTDPRTSGTSGIPHLPRPFYAYFDHEPAGSINVYVGTQGRGMWRITVPADPCVLTTAPPVGAIIGTAGNDDLLGTTGDDVIFGEAGNDRLFGGLGNDTLCGGEGADELAGREGDDRLDGGPGNDKLAGGTGNDTLTDVSGADQLSGDDGDDLLTAVDGSGGDALAGGNHVNGDVCTGDGGDVLFKCNP